MTTEKIAVLVVTVVIAVLLSLTLLSSPGTPVPDVATAPPAVTTVPDQAPFSADGGAAPLGLQEILDGGAATQLTPKPVMAGGAKPEFVGPTAEMVAAATTVRVANGDTLDAIARRLYGRSSAAAEILAANPGLNPKRMKVGTELNLPRKPTKVGAITTAPTVAKAGSARTAEAAPRTTTPGKTHVVAKGEGLGTIAKSRYGNANAWRRIYDANRDKLSSPDRVVAGMKLRIP